MARAPDWTEEEFLLLLSQPKATTEELQAQLPRRSTEAISVVRSGIHDFHNYGMSSLLPQMMVRKLEDPQLSWNCSICLIGRK